MNTKFVNNKSMKSSFARNDFFKVMSSEFKRIAIISKHMFSICILLCAVDAVLALGYTAFLNKLIESLTNVALMNGNPKLCLFFFGLFALVVLLRELSNGILNYALDKQQMRIQGGLKVQLFDRIQQIPILDFEKPDMLDSINKAKIGLEISAMAFMLFELAIANGLIYLVMITVYMASIHPLLCIVILSVFLPTLISYLIKSKYMRISEDMSAPERRRMDMAEASICDRIYFKETRHLGAVDYFIDNFKSAASAFVFIKSKEARSLSIVNFIVNLTQFAGFLTTLATLYYLISSGSVSAGAVAAVIATIGLLYNYLRELFNTQISGIATSYVGVSNFHKVMSTESTASTEVKIEEIHRLRFKDVSFRYPNATSEALININLTISAGETICIVGENGSGKSTLSKLILGLYPATSGSVIINDETIIDNNTLATLRRHASSVFQVFNKYNVSFKDNILIGDIQRTNSDNIDSKLKSLGLEELIASLPEGSDTMLSKEFGGVDLSHGQWQRIAIARGILKPAEIIVFDEPTAAIDPLLELELLERMLNDALHKTRVIVTHRIGIATKADRILVMKDGHLIEDGNHAALMALNGEYARLFTAQSQWYK